MVSCVHEKITKSVALRAKRALIIYGVVFLKNFVYDESVLSQLCHHIRPGMTSLYKEVLEHDEVRFKPPVEERDPITYNFILFLSSRLIYFS